MSANRGSREPVLLADDLRERLDRIIPQFSEQFKRLTAVVVEDDVEAEIELITEQAKDLVLPLISSKTPARLEYNLSRKAIWSTEPNRKVLEFKYQTEDIVGSLTVEYSLGQLSVHEMELVAWIMGRWKPEAPTVEFSLRECAREFGVTWGGSRRNLISDSLHRIDRTRFTGKVWDARTKKMVTRHFGIFDDVQILERRDSLDGESIEPGAATVTVTLSTFMHEQLRERQFVKLDWGVMRGRLQSSLGRRLYAFLESQKGFQEGTLYEITIDSRLAQTLGSRDSNPDRFRTRLRQAGEELVNSSERYSAIVIRAGQAKHQYVLRVERAAA
jgi:hypothetical protein